MIQGKLYVVGMIYVLNQRFYLRRELDGENNNITAIRVSRAEPSRAESVQYSSSSGQPDNY